MKQDLKRYQAKVKLKEYELEVDEWLLKD